MTPQIAHFAIDAPKPSAKGFWWPVIGLIMMSLVLLMAHQGTVLQLGYPVVAFAIGCYFYIKFPVQYIGYIWWIYFLTPELRRLNDFAQGGFTQVSLIMIAPLLVSVPLALTMLRRVRYLATRPGLPILLILLALVYGYIVGTLNFGFSAATFGLSNWFTPLLISFYLAVSWGKYPEYRRCLMRTFTIGTIVCAGYGIIQYMIMPPWDAAWLIWSGMTSSMGSPFPFQIRVWGPLNSLAPFAAVVLVGVLGTTVSKDNRGRTLAAAVGIIGLGLSFVRSAWGALFIAIIYQMLFFDNRTRIRIIIGTLVIAAATIPVFMSSNISENFQKRLDTLSDLQNDSSFSIRSNFYQTFLDKALTNVSGIGIGGTGLSTKLSDDSAAQENENFDSGLMEVPFVLGWPGTLLYVFGMGWLILKAAVATLQCRTDRFVVAWFSVAIAMLSQMIFGNSLIGPSGQLALTGMVLPIMALRYTKYQNALLQKQMSETLWP